MNFERRGTLAAAMLGAVALGGCAFSSSPADALQFAPPPGWRSSPAFLGFMQFWRPAADDREVLMLFRSPRQVDPNQIFADSRVEGNVKDVTVERRTKVYICGAQPAQYFEARGTSSHGETHVDMMITNIAGKTYFAMYARPIELPANPVAEAALRELCTKH